MASIEPALKDKSSNVHEDETLIAIMLLALVVLHLNTTILSITDSCPRDLNIIAYGRVVEPVKGVTIGYVPLIVVKPVAKDENTTIKLYTFNSKNSIPYAVEVEDSELVIEARSYVPLEEPVVTMLLLNNCSIVVEINPPSATVLKHNYSITIVRNEHPDIVLDKKVIDPLGFFYTNLTQQSSHSAAESGAAVKTSTSGSSNTVPGSLESSLIFLLPLVASLVSVLDYLASRRKSRQHG